MNIAECIDQLQSLKCHCMDFTDPEEQGDIWNKDVEALDMAIKILEGKGNE